MVRNLLAITRIDAGALELRRDWVDLREVAERIVSAARRHGARQHIDINLPSDLPLVRADATLAEQAIGNVVANAIIHTPPGTHVVLDAEVTTDGIAVRVTDDGPGIPADRLPTIFDKFVKGPGSSRSGADGGQGTGLGLAIAKGIMEAHAGTIRGESPAQNGRGARFIMTFPPRGTDMSAKIRVLVIDDEAAILRFLKPALEANNYEMASAGTVAEGIKRIAAETPDIVLLDLGLPDGDGKDVIKRAREWSDLPIIVLSAREREVEKIEALDFGADDYVNKPFNVGELLARMRTALRHRMQRKAEIPLLRVGDIEVEFGSTSGDPSWRGTQANAEGI